MVHTEDDKCIEVVKQLKFFFGIWPAEIELCKKSHSVDTEIMRTSRRLYFVTIVIPKFTDLHQCFIWNE